MSSLFKAIMSRFKSEPEPRVITDIHSLQKGDMVKLNDSFALPAELRGGTFEITGIDTYYYGQEGLTEWVLRGGASRKIFMSVSEFDDEERLSFSFKLKGSEVEELFSWKEIKAQFNESHESPLVCSNAEKFENWLTTEYQRRECAGRGEYFSGDYREHPNKPSGGEALDYTEFFDVDERYGVEVERWSKDELDVFVSLIRPLEDIHEMWAK
jgi:hypothetical protein